MAGWGLLANVITRKMLSGPSRRGEVLECHYLHWAENAGESECQRGSRVFHRHRRWPAPGQEDAGTKEMTS